MTSSRVQTASSPILEDDAPLATRALEPAKAPSAAWASPESSAAQALPFRECRWASVWLIIGDLIALEAALLLGWWARSVLDPWLGSAFGVGHWREMALGMLMVPLAYGCVGLYPGYGMRVVERLRRRVYATLILFVMLILWDYLVVKGHTSRGVLLSTLAFAVVLVPTIEAAVRRLLLLGGAWGRPVVILGTGPTGTLLARLLKQEPEMGFVPVADCDDDPATWGTRIEGVPVLGPVGRVRMWLPRVSTALLAMPKAPGSQQVELCAKLRFPTIILVTNLTGLASLWVSTRDLGGIVGLEVKKNLAQRHNWLLKRSLDYLLGVPLFLASLPVLALAAVWIKLVSSNGPVFYTQRRVGLGGRAIRVWKLRTMYPDADQHLEGCFHDNPEARRQWNRNCKLKHDPRVLPGVGSLLRRTSLDELPQLWNVLKGEMSLVGPRPFPHYHLARFDASFRRLRRQVLPGITGMWQVTSRSDGDMDMQEALDTYYIRNWSLWLDLYLLVRTIGAVIAGRGAY